MTRGPSHDWGDVVLRVRPEPSEKTTYGQALVKLTYAIDPFGGPLALTAPRPLVNNLFDEACDPPIPPHSDFWPAKEWIDLAVIGSAHAPEGEPVTDMVAGVAVGGRRKLLRVHGEREIRFRSDGRPEIGPAEPFTEQPLGIEHAYGGLDLRPEPEEEDDEGALLVASEIDWPGLYPRNPWGRGYLCAPDPVEGLRMPTQEDAADPLRPERLVADPRRWWRQPMPGYLDWMPVNCFPRSVFLSIDCDPWFPPPEDATLPEIALGLLPESYRARLADPETEEPHWRMLQESAPGLAFRREEIEGREIVVLGMHPVHDRIEFALPPRPEIDLVFGTARRTGAPALASVEIRPGELTVSLTYHAEIAAPRLFMPGLHATIPFAASVDGRGPVRFRPPETVKRALARAKAGGSDEDNEETVR